MNDGAAAPLLRCAGVGRVFGPPEGRVEVLRGLDLEVRTGDMVAILGESGAGKTTLLHLVGALDRPDTGTIRFRGRDIGAASQSARAAYRNRDIGFVFQFHHLLPEFSAVENAMMPLLIAGQSPRAARERAAARASASSRAMRPIHPGMATFSTAVNSGSRWWNWKTKPTLRLRNFASSSFDIEVTSRSSTRTFPESGRSRPPIRWSSVDFPMPDGPTTASISPLRTSRWRPLKTTTGTAASR